MKLKIRSMKFGNSANLLFKWRFATMGMWCNDFSSLMQFPITVFTTCKTACILSFVINKVIKLRFLPKAGYGFQDFLVHNRSGSGFQTLSGSPIPKYWSIIPWALKGLCQEDIAISGHFCALLPTTYTKWSCRVLKKISNKFHHGAGSHDILVIFAGTA